MVNFVPKPLPYLERVEKAQRIIKAAQHRVDAKLALRELCEAMLELTTALLEREQASKAPPDAGTPNPSEGSAGRSP
jgi:hypothetical protein